MGGLYKGYPVVPGSQGGKINSVLYPDNEHTASVEHVEDAIYMYNKSGMISIANVTDPLILHLSAMLT